MKCTSFRKVSCLKVYFVWCHCYTCFLLVSVCTVHLFVSFCFKLFCSFIFKCLLQVACGFVFNPQWLTFFFILFKYNIGMESAHIFTVWKIVSVWKMPDHCFLKTTSVLFFPLFLYLTYFFDHIPYVFYIPPYVSHLCFFFFFLWSLDTFYRPLSCFSVHLLLCPVCSYFRNCIF